MTNPDAHYTTVAPVQETAVLRYYRLRLYKIATIDQRLRQRLDRVRQLVALSAWQQRREASQQ